jgi:hypothetical protein
VHQWRWVWLRNPELFPTSVRFSGVSIGKQLGIVLGGGISGEPFPGPEPKLRGRKSRTLYGVG